MITLPEFLDGTTPHCGPNTAPLFDSTHPADEERAAAICAGCPLRSACATHALTVPEERGTWGGLTAHQRRRVLSPDDGTWLDAQGRVRLPCGSFPALMAHRRYAETCDRCEAAQQARTATRRLRRLEEEHALGGSEAGAKLHRRMGEPACVRCRAAEARLSAVRYAARRMNTPRPVLAMAS
ncbi:WhiB family transcriptional regulator [Streptomyces sp. EN23]|uniref:WhiB family transcriptional regulator n=1 Tax=Streptomyces sp. EN23 TaxID=212774 RepID=UPI000851E6CE|nr:WhiB family transcriptional regulator [Streptomyces sp. EN23]